MKGKTGKPAMRGGGMARKGVGAALKGGGMARRGVGQALAAGGVAKGATKFPSKTKGGAGMGGSFGSGPQTAVSSGRPTPQTALASGRPSGSSRFKDGGKIKKMALGGPSTPTTGNAAVMKPQHMPGRMPAFPGRPGDLKKAGSGEMGRGGGFGPGPSVSIDPREMNGGFGGGPTATTMPVNPNLLGKGRIINAVGVEPRLAPMPMNPPGGGVEPRLAPMPMNRKHGGKVAKYAKGGAVKMTAGAGSGSGRLEKVEAHKAAPRVKAVGLKKGGKVKGK